MPIAAGEGAGGGGAMQISDLDDDESKIEVQASVSGYIELVRFACLASRASVPTGHQSYLHDSAPCKGGWGLSASCVAPPHPRIRPS